MPGLELIGVRKRYSRAGPWVLDGVDLTIDGGAITAVVAGNGTGKSTLLRLVAGAALPTRGQIRGRPRSVGYVPERAPAAVRMTARQYLTHLGRLRGLPGTEIRARVAELVERFALAPGPDVPVSSLSKGNAMKVAVIAAFLTPPELLVVDEPRTGMDGPATRRLTELIQESKLAGAAILISAHDRPSVVTDRMLSLRKGRLETDARLTMRVVLQARRPGLSIRDVPGFGEVAAQEESGRVVVHTDEADRLLVGALARDWSLIEAGPCWH